MVQGKHPNLKKKKKKKKSQGQIGKPQTLNWTNTRQRATRLGTYNHQIEEEENMFRDRKQRVKERSGRLEVKSGHFERNFSKGTSIKAQVAKPWC